MADYIVNVIFDDKDTIDILEKKYQKAKAQIEGEQLKVRITDDPKDIEELQKKIKSLSASKVSQLHLSVDRKGFAEQLDAMKKYTENTSQEIAGIFKKNVKNGITSFSENTKNMTASELFHELGGEGNFSKNNLQSLIGKMFEQTKGEVNADRTYISIVKQAEAYEKLSTFLGKIKGKDLAKLQGIKEAIGFDKSSFGNQMRDFYQSVDKMMFNVDVNKKWQGEIEKSFQTLVENIAAVQKSILDDVKIGMGGNGNGGGFGGELSEEAKKIQEEIDDYTNRIMEASGKLKKAQEELEKIQNTKDTLGGKLNLIYKDYVENSYKWDDKKINNVEKQLFAMMTAYKDKGGNIPKNIQKLYGDFQKRFKTPDMSLIPDLSSEIESAKKNVDQIQNQLNDLESKKKQAEEKLQQIMSGSGTGGTGSGTGSGEGGGFGETDSGEKISEEIEAKIKEIKDAINKANSELEQAQKELENMKKNKFDLGAIYNDLIEVEDAEDESDELKQRLEQIRSKFIAAYKEMTTDWPKDITKLTSDQRKMQGKYNQLIRLDIPEFSADDSEIKKQEELIEDIKKRRLALQEQLDQFLKSLSGVGGEGVAGGAGTPGGNQTNFTANTEEFDKAIAHIKEKLGEIPEEKQISFTVNNENFDSIIEHIKEYLNSIPDAKEITIKEKLGQGNESDNENNEKKISFIIDTEKIDKAIEHIREQIESIPDKKEIEINIKSSVDGLLDKIKEQISDGIEVNLKPVWKTGETQKQTQRSKEEVHSVSRKRADGTEVTHTTKTSSNTSSQTGTSAVSNDVAPRAVSSIDNLKTANNQLATAAQQAGNKGASAMEQIADAADRAVRKVTKLRSEWDISDLMARWDSDNWSVERASYINTATGKFSKDVRGTNSRKIQGKDLAVSFSDARAKNLMPDYILHTHPDSKSASLSISDIDMALSQVKDGIKGIISVAGDEIAKIDVKSLVDNGFDFDKFKDQWLMNYNKLISDMTKTSPSYTDLLDANDNINKVLADSISDSLKEFNIDIKSSEISNAIDSLVKNLSNSIENYSKQGKEIVDFTVIDDSLYNYIRNFVSSIGKENVGTKAGISLSNIIQENMENALFWRHPQFDTSAMEKYVKDNPSLQQSLTAKSIRQTLSAMSSNSIDLSKFFTVQSRDDFLRSIGLDAIHIDTNKIHRDMEEAFTEPIEVKTKTSDDEIRREVQEEFDTPIEPKINIEGTSLRAIIQEELSQPFDVELQPSNTLRSAIEKMLQETFNVNIDVNNINTNNASTKSNSKAVVRGQTPSEVIAQMLRADAWMSKNFEGEGYIKEDGKEQSLGPLKERAMYFSSKTGWHTNPFIFDRQSSMSDYKIIDSIPKDNLKKYQVDSQMHSHPEKYSFMSIDNYDKTTKRYSGDLTAFLQRYVENGIKNQVIAAQKDVQVFDFDSFVKDNGKLFGDVDSNGVFKRNDKKEQDFIEKFSEKRKSFYKNMQDDLDIMLELRKVVDDDSIFRLPVFNSGNMKDFMNANVLQKAVSSFSNGHSTKEYNDHFWKYVEENKANIQGGIEGAIKQYIGDAFKAYSQGAFQGRAKKLNESYNDIMQSFDRNYLDSVISELFNTRSNGGPFDVAYKLTSLKAFKSMGIDFSKYNQFMSLDKFEHFYDKANESTGFVPKQSDIDASNVSKNIQDSISSGGPYKIQVEAEFDGIPAKLQSAIDEGAPYQVKVKINGDSSSDDNLFKSTDEIVNSATDKITNLSQGAGANYFTDMLKDIRPLLESNRTLAMHFYDAIQNIQGPTEFVNIISSMKDIQNGAASATDAVELFNKSLSEGHKLSTDSQFYDGKPLSSTIQDQIDSGNPYNIQIKSEQLSQQIQGMIDEGNPYNIEIGIDGSTGSLQQQIQDIIDNGNPYKIKIEAENESLDTGDAQKPFSVDEGSISKSPSQTFDNEIQQNLVSLENYKNTIAEIDKLKLEPETDETKAKLEELNTLADYFASQITLIKSEGGHYISPQMLVGWCATGGFSENAKSKYTNEQLNDFLSIARERNNRQIISNPPEFAHIGNELSNIESKSESLRQSLNKTLSESRDYVTDIKRRFLDLMDSNIEIKTETNKRDIEDYQKDIDRILQKYPELQQFMDKFTSFGAARDFTQSDDWNDFLSTLPQAHAYLEALGYDFEKINKKEISAQAPQTENLRQTIEEGAQAAETTATEESSTIETLISKIREVADAVEIKTNRFREEGEVVTGVVQSEMTMLDGLLGEINMIVQDLNGLSSAIKSLPEIELKMKEIGEGSTINSEIMDALDRIKRIFQDFNAQNITSFTGALKEIKFSEANVKSIENLAAAIELLVEQMSKLNGQDFSSGMFSSINELLSHSDELEDLAKILQESTEKINAAGKAAGSDNGMENDAKAKAETDALEKYYKEQLEVIQKYYDTRTRMNELEAKAVGDKNFSSTKQYADALEALTKAAQDAMEALEKLDAIQDKLSNDQMAEAGRQMANAMVGSESSRYKIDEAQRKEEEKRQREEAEKQAKWREENEKELAKREAERQKNNANMRSKWEKAQSTNKNTDNSELIKTYQNDLKAIKNMAKDAEAAKEAMKEVFKLMRAGDISRDQYNIAKSAFDSGKEKLSSKENLQEYNNILDIIKQATDARSNFNKVLAQSIKDSNIKNTTEDMEKLAEASEKATQAVEKLDQMFEEGKITQAQYDDAVNKYMESLIGNQSSRKQIKNAEKWREDSNTRSELTTYQNAVNRYQSIYSKGLSRDLTIDEQQEMAASLQTIRSIEQAWNEDKAEGIRLTNKQEDAHKSLLNAMQAKNSNTYNEDFTKNIIEESALQEKAFKEFEAVQKKVSNMRNQTEWRANQDDWLKQIGGLEDKLGNINLNIKNKDDFDKLMKDLENIRQEQQAISKDSDWIPLASDWKAKAGADLSKWMNQNKMAAKEFGEQLKQLAADIDEVGSKGGQENWNARFQDIQRQAAEGGFLGKSLGDRFKDQFKNTMTSLATYYLSFQDFIRYGREAINIIVELDTAMTNLKKVADDSATSFDKFRNTAFDIAKETGSTATGVIDAATEWARLGYSLEDSAKLSKASVIYSNVGEIDTTQATTDLVSVLKAFKMDSEDALHAVDVLNEIGIYKIIPM